MNYILQFNSYKVDTISKLKITKGQNSVNNVGQVMFLDLCSVSDHALYLYQWGKISQSFSDLLSRHEKCTKENNSIKNCR